MSLPKALMHALIVFGVVLATSQVLSASNSNARAERFDPATYTGNSLLADCTSEDVKREIVCLVVVGDTMFGKTGISVKKPDGSKCFPSGVTVLQVKDIVVKKLREHPEIRHLMGHGLVLGIIRDTFDCVAVDDSELEN
jgi:hypothetical protein